MTFSFDEWRAARTKGGPRTVTFCGQSWTIPAELPWVVADYFGRSTRVHLAPAVRVLFGDPEAFGGDEAAAVAQFDRFTALRLSEDEVTFGLLFQAVPSWYAEGGGEDPGNSDGSTEPSTSTSEPSEPTSDDSTAST